MLTLNLNLVFGGGDFLKIVQLLPTTISMIFVVVVVALQFLKHFQEAIVLNYLLIFQGILKQHDCSFINSFITKIVGCDRFISQLNNVKVVVPITAYNKISNFL